MLFVGEALVGNDGVDQLKAFNQALADHSGQDNPRLIDGIVLTKFDTIDDKVSLSIFHVVFQKSLAISRGYWLLAKRGMTRSFSVSFVANL